MSQEALSMAKLLIGCVTRGDVDGQYHWANLIMLDALANGAKGPQQLRNEALAADRDKLAALLAEDAIEEARR